VLRGCNGNSGDMMGVTLCNWDGSDCHGSGWTMGNGRTGVGGVMQVLGVSGSTQNICPSHL